MPDELPAESNRTVPREPAVTSDLPAAETSQPNTSRPGTPAGGTVPRRGPPPVPADRGPPQVPGYEVTREIARGGMGAVFAARDLALTREVAIKVVLPGATDPQAAARFVREAEITGRLAHPGIPPVHQLGELPGGQPFLAMKLVRGRTLAEILACRAAGEKSVADPVRVFEQIAQAVGYAHSQGVTHRDLKPANVMVGAFGEVQVMDWGLARAAGASEQEGDSTPESPLQTRAGRVMGTPAYMAPEQARGEPVDAHADVFALGGILCAILTGGAPFAGESVREVLKRAAAGDVADALARLDGCPADRELVAIATRCLSPAARDRFADGEEVAAAVARHREGVEARLRRAERDRAAAEARAEEEANTRREAEAREAEQRKRRRAQLALVAAVALLFAGAGAAGWWLDRQAGQRRTELQEQEHREELRQTELRRKESEARAAGRTRDAAVRARYLRQVSLAYTRLLQNDLPAARRLLDDCPPHLRNWEWDYLDRISNGGGLALPGHTKEVTCAAFSRDGARVATAGFDGIRVWEASTGKLLATLPHRGDVKGIAFTPEGRLVTPGKQSVVVWDVPGATVRKSLTGPKQEIECVTVSRDGRRIAAAGKSSETRPGGPVGVSLWHVHVWDAGSGEVVRVIRADTGKVSALSFAPDGRIAVAGESGVEVWGEGDRPAAAFRGHLDRVTCAAFSADGKWVASGGADGKVVLWDARAGERRRVLQGHTSRVTGVAVTPDGRQVVSTGRDSTYRVWDAASGYEVRAVLAHAGDVTACALSPDGKALVTAGEDRLAKLWKVDAEPGGRTIRVEAVSDENPVAISRDGNLVAAVAAEADVRVWDAATGRELHAFGKLPGGVHAVAFSPDARLLAAAGFDFEQPGWVKVWDLKSGAEHQAVPWPNEPATALAFSPDGKSLACAGGGRVELETQRAAPGSLRVWDFAAARYRFQSYAPPGVLRCVAYGPDGRRLVTGGYDGMVRLWDAATGAQLRVQEGHQGRVYCVDYSPDGRTIASGGEDRAVRLWDAADGRALFALEGHLGRVRGAAFGRGGSRLASVGEDRTLRIWDVETGQEAIFIQSPGVSWEGVSFDTVGRRIAVRGSLDRVRVFDASPLPPIPR